MTTSVPFPEVAPSGSSTRDADDRRWDRARHGLIVCWLLFLLTIPLAGERTAEWSDVEHLVESGKVTDVRVVGELPRTATGFATVDVHWRHGPLRYVTTVRQVHDDSAEATTAGGEVSEVLHRAPSERLAQLQPGVRIGRHASLSYRDDSILGFRVPTGLVLVGLALTLAGLVVLVRGPRPWRATPWAWFWWFSNPLGVAAFLVLCGPVPGLPAPRDVNRRLTGGWSFLLMAVVTSVSWPR